MTMIAIYAKHNQLVYWSAH